MTQDEMLQLFVPHILERMKVIRAGKRLVHYTSAESAYKIISSGQIWLRNAQMMNDFSEIRHGIDCLVEAWASPTGLKLQSMLERLKEGLRDELANIFDGHTDGFKSGTYLLSLSEHENDEDELGRLSMWRAYGGSTGVALILNNSIFLSDIYEMRVFSSPVFYYDVKSFVDFFESWARRLIEGEELIKNLGAESVRNLLFMVFRAFALCTKHPGFSEEKEWRVYYSPLHEGDSDWVEPAVEIINGVPQHIVKLALRDDVERGVTGVAPATLLNRVIIGPCEFPVQVRAAIGDAMRGAGIDDPLKMMWMSLIPYRQ